MPYLFTATTLVTGETPNGLASLEVVALDLAASNVSLSNTTDATYVIVGEGCVGFGGRVSVREIESL